MKPPKKLLYGFGGAVWASAVMFLWVMMISLPIWVIGLIASLLIDE
jgi:hypothetical protein